MAYPISIDVPRVLLHQTNYIIVMKPRDDMYKGGVDVEINSNGHKYQGTIIYCRAVNIKSMGECLPPELAYTMAGINPKKLADVMATRHPNVEIFDSLLIKLTGK